MGSPSSVFASSSRLELRLADGLVGRLEVLRVVVLHFAFAVGLDGRGDERLRACRGFHW